MTIQRCETALRGLAELPARPPAELPVGEHRLDHLGLGAPRPRRGLSIGLLGLGAHGDGALQGRAPLGLRERALGGDVDQAAQRPGSPRRGSSAARLQSRAHRRARTHTMAPQLPGGRPPGLLTLGARGSVVGASSVPMRRINSLVASASAASAPLPSLLRPENSRVPPYRSCQPRMARWSMRWTHCGTWYRSPLKISISRRNLRSSLSRQPTSSATISGDRHHE